VPTYVSSILSPLVYLTFFSMASSLNIGHRACASLTIVGIERETDVCVRVCACVYCTHVLTFCVCLSQAALCASSTFFSAVRRIYLSLSCYISSSFVYSQRVLIHATYAPRNDATERAHVSLSCILVYHRLGYLASSYCSRSIVLIPHALSSICSDTASYIYTSTKYI
jgi:hypothetical protein